MTDRKHLLPLRITVWAVMILQMAVAILYADRYAAGAEGLKIATCVYEGDKITAAAPVMSLMGLICRLIKLHPLIFAHTVMVIVIPLSYLCYRKLFDEIFEKSRSEVYMALLILELINIYGYYSDALESFSLLTGYFTGWGILMHVLIPLAAAALIKRTRSAIAEKAAESISGTGQMRTSVDITGQENMASVTETEDYQEEWDMKKHPIINARNLAIALAVLAVVLLASIFVLNNKINTLYDATVNLQNQLNEYVDESGE